MPTAEEILSALDDLLSEMPGAMDVDVRDLAQGVSINPDDESERDRCLSS
jgi:hypothetical protein